MIDIHCHILPGLDDGSKDIDQSIEMVMQAEAQGIRSIIATPHHANELYRNESEQVLPMLERLNEALEQRNLSPRILPGQEIRVYGEILNDYRQGRLLTLAGSRYLLLELPTMQIPVQVLNLIDQLRMLGVIPIIAHPERNFAIFQNPNRLSELVERGALSQLTAHSIAGKRGKKLQDFCLDLCKQQLIHFIASDAHNVSNRGFILREAYEAVNRTLGNEYRNYYLENSEKLVDDLPIEKLILEKPKKKFFFFH